MMRKQSYESAHTNKKLRLSFGQKSIHYNHPQRNKLQATLVRNYYPLTDSLTDGGEV